MLVFFQRFFDVDYFDRVFRGGVLHMLLMMFLASACWWFWMVVVQIDQNCYVDE